MDTYEKKYKNALTIAQSRFKIEKDESVLTCLGMMFPELRESEDEAIRKSIVATIEQCPDDFLNPKNRDRMLDWLEKQKEPHIPWYDYQKSKDAGYTIVPNEEYEQLVKQKEQEPQVFCEAKAFDLGYKQSEKDILSFVESRISEIIGDAQPKPALRAELEELIKRIKDGNNAGRANTTM